MVVGEQSLIHNRFVNKNPDWHWHVVASIFLTAFMIVEQFMLELTGLRGEMGWPVLVVSVEEVVVWLTVPLGLVVTVVKLELETVLPGIVGS